MLGGVRPCFGFGGYSRAGGTAVVDKVTDPWLKNCGVNMAWGFLKFLRTLLYEHGIVHILKCGKTSKACVPTDQSISLRLVSIRYL